MQGDLYVLVKGKWVETILYEIPLLVLISECYFKFSNTDWNYDGQEEKAYVDCSPARGAALTVA